MFLAVAGEMLHAFPFLVQLTSWSKGPVQILVSVTDYDFDKIHCLPNLRGCTSVSTAMTHMDQETTIEATQFPRVQRKLITMAGVTVLFCLCWCTCFPQSDSWSPDS